MFCVALNDYVFWNLSFCFYLGIKTRWYLYTHLEKDSTPYFWISMKYLVGHINKRPAPQNFFHFYGPDIYLSIHIYIYIYIYIYSYSLRSWNNTHKLCNLPRQDIYKMRWPKMTLKPSSGFELVYQPSYYQI